MDLNNRNMNLVLSTDAKPRLKWTPELHQRFIEAVNQLGGAEKATPKSLMRVMGIPGLTLYHLKSHLQKFRLGKSQHSETSSDNKQEDYREVQSSDGHSSRELSVANGNHYDQISESFKIAQALQVQMEVQTKLHEQIEVQRHLQLRIEAQGKYIQSVLKKAQETLARYNSSSIGIELAKAELSQLVSIFNTGCPSSPISELTETRVLTLNDTDVERKQMRDTICSLESSLTSSESSDRNDEKQTMREAEDPKKSNTICSIELPLMALHPGDTTLSVACGRKRSGIISCSDCACVEQQLGKTKRCCKNVSRESGLTQMIDLNTQYQSDSGSSSKTVDLNCKL